MDLLLLLKALILGIIEGLTEFLPISSTGHLIIAGSLLGYTDDQSKVFKIVIQLGAILAVCWDFRERIGKVARGITHDPVQQRFAALLFVGFLPAAVLGLLFHSTIKTYLFNPLTVAGALIVGGLLILYIERRAYHPHIEGVDNLRWQDALKVGFAQALAMFPGVSRSGATIMGGLVFGLSRKTATEFSFFLAIPTMFAATLYDVAKSWKLLHIQDLPVFAVGFVAAFVAAMLTVKALLRYVANHDFTLFAWYRIVFGIIVLLTAQMGWVEWAAG
ncbi:MAG TPA: undecaprenyl-diphosphate phosphatase [Rhodocyclaceae bacterium]|nr:undecaprenyl-diphosphate phosphatase [Rhodocyclaceae bacterium]